MTTYKELNSCLACESKALHTYLNLGDQPLANSYHKPDEPLEKYPLKLNVCERCFHSQLSVAVNPDLLFKHYLYVSGTSKTLTQYFSWFAKQAIDRQLCTQDSTSDISVLDIASNDGSLLQAFRAMGVNNVLGVDPALNLTKLAWQKKIPTLPSYWNETTANAYADCFDIITAQNVVAHVSDPAPFLTNISKALRENGTAYVQTSQSEMIPRGEFDTAYHEHHSFFTINSMNQLAQRSNLHLNDVFKTEIHGSSYVFVLKKSRGNSQTILPLIDQERAEGRYSIETYNHFAKQAHDKAEAIRQKIQAYREKGFRIAGYGAAAKGNTFLNFSNLSLETGKS